LEYTRISSSYAKKKLKSRKMSSMKRWNVWAALRRLNDMKENSNKPNGMHGNLMIYPYQVDLREDSTACQVVWMVVDVPDRVAVRDGPGVEGSVIPARSSTVVFLGDQVEC
jgi:hypothetical protein